MSKIWSTIFLSMWTFHVFAPFVVFTILKLTHKDVQSPQNIQNNILPLKLPQISRHNDITFFCLFGLLYHEKLLLLKCVPKNNYWYMCLKTQEWKRKMMMSEEISTEKLIAGMLVALWWELRGAKKCWSLMPERRGHMKRKMLLIGIMGENKRQWQSFQEFHEKKECWAK